MKNEATIKKLNQVKYTSAALLFISTAFIAFGPHFILAILLILLSCFLDWKYYRCPHCHETLDTRMKLNSETHCPNCGKVISEAPPFSK